MRLSPLVSALWSSPPPQWELLLPWLTYLRLAFCDNDGEYRFFMGLVAAWFQRPWERPQIMLLVTSSDEGEGKSLLVQILLWIFGAALGLSTSNKDMVFGKCVNGCAALLSPLCRLSPRLPPLGLCNPSCQSRPIANCHAAASDATAAVPPAVVY